MFPSFKLFFLLFPNFSPKGRAWLSFSIPSLNSTDWKYRDMGSYPKSQIWEYPWNAQLTSDSWTLPAVLKRGRPERQAAQPDLNGQGVYLTQRVPIQKPAVAGNVGYSKMWIRSIRFFLGIFNWRAGGRSHYHWKVNLTVNNVKETRRSTVSHAQVDVIRKQKLRSHRNCEVESLSCIKYQLWKLVARERRKK